MTGGIDDSVKVWAWRNEQLELRHRLEGHALGVVSVDTSSDGKCNYIKVVYSLRNNISIRKLLFFSVIATSSLDSYIRIWDLQSGEKNQTIESGPVDVWSVTFTPDSKHIVSGSHAGKINWFSVETGKPEQSFDTRGKFTLSIACVCLNN